ncbi:MAG TPA: hypothetical protein VN512_12725 [Clostridia bacterium]|nr:hypothetical protein [Clostridia bacterium]
MIERVNGGDKEALRELMSRCTRPMYDRALEITGDIYAAKDAVRRALRELAEAARHGECPEEVDSWAILLAERSCDEELYYKRLIDGMIAELPLAAHERRPLCADKPARENPAEETTFSERAYAAEESPKRMYEPAEAEPASRAYPPKESAPQAAFASERRAMPGAAQPERAFVKQPSDEEAPAKEEPDEEAGIFAPSKKKKSARALREETPVEEDEEEEDEEYAYYAPRKKKSRRGRKSEVPDLFGDEDTPEESVYEGEEENGKPKGGGLLALLIIVLTLVAAGLLWVIAVKLARLGYLGISDFGFADWFNEHLFNFY